MERTKSSNADTERNRYEDAIVAWRQQIRQRSTERLKTAAVCPLLSIAVGAASPCLRKDCQMWDVLYANCVLVSLFTSLFTHPRTKTKDQE